MENYKVSVILCYISFIFVCTNRAHGRILPSNFVLPIRHVAPLQAPPTAHPVSAPVRVKRGAAYPGGHGDFSGVAKMSTFAALGTYGGYLGHGKGSTAGGYGAGSGRNGLDAAGGITISGALGSYGSYLGHKGPTVISSGGFGNGGLLFNKI